MVSILHLILKGLWENHFLTMCLSLYICKCEHWTRVVVLTGDITHTIPSQGYCQRDAAWVFSLQNGRRKPPAPPFWFPLVAAHCEWVFPSREIIMRLLLSFALNSLQCQHLPFSGFWEGFSSFVSLHTFPEAHPRNTSISTYLLNLILGGSWWLTISTYSSK